MVPTPTLPLPRSYNDLSYGTIQVAHHPASSLAPTPVLILTLYRPNSYNAFNFDMQREVEEVMMLADIDDRIKVVVVTGHGRIFCAGADLAGDKPAFQRDTTIRTPDQRDGGGQMALSIYRCRKPVIGAIQGSAVGIGITMTLSMTIRIAPKTAKIGFVFARRGLVMEACSSFFLPKLIGMSRALHITATGATYMANDPLLSGLFSEVTEKPEQVLPRALAIADDIAANCSNVSVMLMKEMMYRNPGTAEGTHLLDSKIMWELFGSQDNVEGVKSFIEKRAVNFTGSVIKDAPNTYPWHEPVQTVPRIMPDTSKSKL